MHEPSVAQRSVGTSTWIGLLIALFGMLVVRQVAIYFWPTMTLPATIGRESFHWSLAAALLLIIFWGERLPLSSVGIGTAPVQRSLGWAIVVALACVIVGFAIAIATRFNGGRSGEALGKLPTWLLILIVLRAGVIEELFYRGYAIERLQAIGLSRYLAVLVPVLVFGVAHWRGGWPNIVIALALGTILSISYLWRRDLVANMIAHFSVDFIGIILPRLIHQS